MGVFGQKIFKDNKHTTVANAFKVIHRNNRVQRHYSGIKGVFRERSFLMPGTRAEGNCLVYENCSSWDPGV